jgi:hypothetical protein
MKLERNIQQNLFISLLLILILSINCVSQTSESNEESDVIPEQVMEQIVRKVLIHYFKPRSQKKVIYLSDELIKQSWLPKIKGVDFQLVNFLQLRDKGTWHHRFNNTWEDEHLIGFGYGSWFSGFSGDMWHFRISKQTAKIWKGKSEWGSSGMDHGNSPDIPLPIPPPPPMPKKP